MELIDKITEAIEMVSEESKGYYYTETGEIVWVFDFDNDDEELLYDMEENYQKYIPLPTQYDIHEYSIMRDFADEIGVSSISAQLNDCLRGKGAFRRFKDKVYYLGIEKEWFAYKAAAYRQIAENWCEEHKDEL